MPLDCARDICPELFETQWIFFEFVADRFGPRIVADVWDAARSFGLDGGMTAPIDAALRRRGTSLSRVFNQYTRANLALDYELPRGTVRALRGQQRFELVVTRYPAAFTLTVDQLAANYVSFRNLPAAACRVTALRVEIVLPKASAAVPSFLLRRPRVERVYDFRIQGGRATLTVPWRTCRDTSAILAVSNPSVNLDCQGFAVRRQAVRPEHVG